MLNTVLMVMIGLVFIAFFGYLAFDSWREYKDHEPK